MIFRHIDGAKKADLCLARTCGLFGESTSGYYAWKGCNPSRRQLDDMVLLAHIRSQFRLSHETYGSPRMTVELREDGIAVGRHRVARLMRENGLNAVQRRRFKKTTDSADDDPVAPNVLDRDFAADGPDQKWGADISSIWTAEGWLYLAIVVDLFSRRIVGWATSDRMKKDLTLTALKRALATRQPPRGLIHHSDRGSQYCSGDYRKLFADYKIVASMMRKRELLRQCHGRNRVQGHQIRDDQAHHLAITLPGR